MSDERIASKAARLRWIERKLYNNPQGIRVVDLAASTGMDRRTIYRDIASLEDLGIPVWQLDGKFGINREDYLSTVRLNLNQTIALFFAARLLAHHSDEHNPHVVAALDKIASSLPDETIAAHLTRVSEQIQERPTRREYISVLETFTRAWADRRVVQFSYWATGRDEPEERTVAPYVLPAAIQRLRARHAAMRVELREDYSAVLARLLLDGALDVVIAAVPYPFEHLDTERLGVDALVVAVPATHPAARAGRITLAQLHDAPAVTLDPMHCLGEQVAGFCSSRAVSPSVVCRSAQLATVLELVGAGVGVSIVPAMAAARHNTPQCAYVPLADHTLQREIVAVWRRGAARTPQANAFVECVREVVRGR